MLTHDRSWQVAAGLAISAITNLVVGNVPAQQTGVAVRAAGYGGGFLVCANFAVRMPTGCQPRRNGQALVTNLSRYIVEVSQ